MSNTEIVRLNVGGTKYITAKSTLQKYPQSMLGAMFRENIPLSTDEDGYYFIDRCGHIFQYILQFLRCGKLVLPKHFNELELLQTEADFYQIEDLISAVEHRKRELEVKQRAEVHVLLLCIFHYEYWGSLKREVKLLKSSKDTGFKFVAHNCDGINMRAKEIRRYLKSDGWVLEERKSLDCSSAAYFFSLRGIERASIFGRPFRYTNADIETWIRNPSFNFQIFL